jgi:hypothetical protein
MLEVITDFVQVFTCRFERSSSPLVVPSFQKAVGFLSAILFQVLLDFIAGLPNACSAVPVELTPNVLGQNLQHVVVVGSSSANQCFSVNELPSFRRDPRVPSRILVSTGCQEYFLSVLN